jgi:hypothetical protein
MTAIRLPEARDLFSRTLSFPATDDEVLAELGDVTIEAQFGTDETIGDAIERSGADEFDTADELFDTLLACVGEEYVGRKQYDDRGATVGYDDEVSL